MIAIEAGSLAGRVVALLDDLHRKGQLSTADAAVVHALLWHPDLPEFFRMAESAPQTARMKPTN